MNKKTEEAEKLKAEQEQQAADLALIKENMRKMMERAGMSATPAPTTPEAVTPVATPAEAKEEEAAPVAPETIEESVFSKANTYKELYDIAGAKSPMQDADGKSWGFFTLKVELDRFLAGRISKEDLPKIPGLAEKAEELRSKEEESDTIIPIIIDPYEDEKETLDETYEPAKPIERSVRGEMRLLEYRRREAEKKVFADAFEDARQEYLAQYKYQLQDEVSSKASGRLWGKIKDFWGGRKVNEEKAGTAYRIAKEGYDKTSDEYSKYLINSAKERLIGRGKSPEAADAILARYAGSLVFKEIVLKDQAAKTQMEREKYPPEKKNFVGKTADWFMKLPKYQRTLLTAGIATGVYTVGGALVHGVTLSSLGLAYFGNQLVARVIVSGTASAVGTLTKLGLDFTDSKITKAIRKSKEKKGTDSLSALRSEFATGKLDAKTYQKKYETIQEKERTLERNKFLVKTAVVFGVTIWTGAEAKADMQGTNFGIKSAADWEKTHPAEPKVAEVKVTIEEQPAPEEKPIVHKEPQEPAVEEQHTTKPQAEEQPVKTEPTEKEAPAKATAQEPEAKTEPAKPKAEAVKPRASKAGLIESKNPAVANEAIVQKGEGIEHAFARQIEADPNLQSHYGWTGKGDLHEFAQKAAHRAALEYGYVDADGNQIWVKTPGTAYQIEFNPEGKVVVNEFSVKGDFIETHARGDAFEDGAADKDEIEHTPKASPEEVLKGDDASNTDDTHAGDAHTEPKGDDVKPEDAKAETKSAKAKADTEPKTAKAKADTAEKTKTPAGTKGKVETISVDQLPDEDIVAMYKDHPELLAQERSKELLNELFKEYNGLQEKLGAQTQLWENIKGADAGRFMEAWDVHGTKPEYEVFGQKLHDLAGKYGYTSQGLEGISVQDALNKLEIMAAKDQIAEAKSHL